MINGIAVPPNRRDYFGGYHELLFTSIARKGSRIGNQNNAEPALMHLRPSLSHGALNFSRNFFPLEICILKKARTVHELRRRCFLCFREDNVDLVARRKTEIKSVTLYPWNPWKKKLPQQTATYL